jgi:mannose-6-phosphate isomerase-like protein (cupin superfamily)
MTGTHSSEMDIWKDKPWGRTRPRCRSAVAHVDEIEIAAGGYCSIHCHAAKCNVFHVLSGRLYVRQFTSLGDRLRGEHISPGCSVIVPPGIWHQFWAPTETRAVEVYMPVGAALVHEDIERHSGLPVGGIELSYHGMGELWAKAFLNAHALSKA